MTTEEHGVHIGRYLKLDPETKHWLQTQLAKLVRARGIEVNKLMADPTNLRKDGTLKTTRITRAIKDLNASIAMLEERLVGKTHQ